MRGRTGAGGGGCDEAASRGSLSLECASIAEAAAWSSLLSASATVVVVDGCGEGPRLRLRLRMVAIGMVAVKSGRLKFPNGAFGVCVLGSTWLRNEAK